MSESQFKHCKRCNNVIVEDRQGDLICSECREELDSESDFKAEEILAERMEREV